MRRLTVVLSLIFLAAGAAWAETPASGADGRESLAVTVYGAGMGLVSENRRVTLGEGRSGLRLEDVSPKMAADSVRLAVEGAVVRGLALEQAPLTPRALLARHVGKTIEVVRVNPATGAEQRTEAEVLSVADGLVLRIDGRVETGIDGRLSFPDLPADLSPRPSLVADLAVSGAGPRDLELAYLADGLAWRPVHVIDLNARAGTLGLESRAVLSNLSGIDLENAAVSLVAGDVARRTPRPEPKAEMMTLRAAAAPAMDGEPDREAVGGYHLYRLPGKLTLPDGATKQAALLSAAAVPYRRTLISEGHPQVFGPQRGRSGPDHPVIEIAFANDASNGPGEPVPGGLARVFGRDSTGAIRLLGEATLADTPVGETAELTLGRSFDVTVRREQTAFDRISNRVTEAAFRIVVRNGGADAASVEVRENVPGDWEVTRASAQARREDGAAVWTVETPAGGEAVVTYRVRVTR